MSRARRELDALKLRLFGDGNTECMNVSYNHYSGNAIISDHATKINDLRQDVRSLENQVKTLVEAAKKPARKPAAKKVVAKTPVTRKR